MRIEQSSNTANLRLLFPTQAVRPPTGGSTGSGVSTGSGRSRSDSFTSHRQAAAPTSERPRASSAGVADVAITSVDMPSSAQLAAEPRFSVLIELMERLTGREIKLLPPATMMFGARKHVPGATEVGQPQVSGSAKITGVTPLDGGQAFRIDVTAALEDGGTASVQFDIGMDVIQDHGLNLDARSEPLRVHVSADAVVSHPAEPLVIHSTGTDAVGVTSQEVHLDQGA